MIADDLSPEGMGSAGWQTALIVMMWLFGFWELTVHMFILEALRREHGLYIQALR